MKKIILLIISIIFFNINISNVMTQNQPAYVDTISKTSPFIIPPECGINTSRDEKTCSSCHTQEKRELIKINGLPSGCNKCPKASSLAAASPVQFKLEVVPVTSTTYRIKGTLLPGTCNPAFAVVFEIFKSTDNWATADCVLWQIPWRIQNPSFATAATYNYEDTDNQFILKAAVCDSCIADCAHTGTYYQSDPLFPSGQPFITRVNILEDLNAVPPYSNIIDPWDVNSTYNTTLAKIQYTVPAPDKYDFVTVMITTQDFDSLVIDDIPKPSPPSPLPPGLDYDSVQYPWYGKYLLRNNNPLNGTIVPPGDCKVFVFIDGKKPKEGDRPIKVLGIDLALKGVDETNEETVGGFVVVNNDDDNKNGIVDSSENPVTGENDLIQLLINQKVVNAGRIVLSAEKNGDKIELWGDKEKNESSITLPQIWTNFTAIPKELWIEGIVPSTSIDDNVVLVLEYYEGINKIQEDKVKITVVGIESITIIPKGTPDGYVLPEPVEIAAGAINSEAHQADVTIKLTNNLANIPVKIKIENGRGHEAGKDAKLVMDSTIAIGSGPEVTVKSNAQGEITGLLTSSDVLDSTVIIHTGDKNKNVSFTWDKFDDEEPFTDTNGDGEYTPGEPYTELDGNGVRTFSEWISIPPYFEINKTSTETLRLRHHRGNQNDINWKPLKDHQILFFVEEVEYIDNYDSLRILKNTPDSPQDLSEWASFPDTPSTSTYGLASATLTIGNKPEMVSLSMVAYDFTVWDEPSPLANAVPVFRSKVPLLVSSSTTDPRNDHNDETKNIKNVPNVGVKQITSGGVVSTTDNPGMNETLYVAKGVAGATITITATPDPDTLNFPADTPVWTNAKEVTGTSTAKFSIDTVSSTADGTTVIATCRTSSKAMKIVVIGIEITNPIDTNADGKVNDFATNENNLTGNAFGYDRSSPTNICTIPVRVKIKPDNAAIQTLFKDKVTVKLDTISNAGFTSNLTWEDAVEGDPSTGNLKYDESLGLWEATAKFNGLPAVPAGSWGRVPKGLRNLLYGKRSAVVTVLNPTGSGNIYVKNESYEVYFGDSLVIGGIKMAETTENFIDHIKTLLMLNTLSTEIYEKMNCSTETFDFADDNKAIDNFLMRLNVISNMKKMDADPKQLDVGYIGDGYDIGGITYKFARAGDTYYYGTGPDYHEGNEWEHNNDYPNYVGIFKKKTGVTSYLAISKIYPFRGECAGAAEICLFQSAIDVYGSDRFNAVHPADFGVGTFLYNNVKKHRSIIWDKSDRNINGGDSTTLVPGDYIYMKNKDDYTENSSGMWAGENCFYYGLDISGKAKFGGLGKGLSDITEEEMRDILEFEYEGEPLNDLDHDGIYDPQDGETYTIIINNGEWDKGDCYDRTVDNPETEIRFTKIGRIKTGE